MRAEFYSGPLPPAEYFEKLEHSTPRRVHPALELGDRSCGEPYSDREVVLGRAGLPTPALQRIRPRVHERDGTRPPRPVK